ncbi:MAG: zinc-ribbon domain-containing protein, partial [Thermoplasmata archaeon]|nr:zinc-ribbon domain-containing protein [Thermoplasmata archaeon]
TPVAEASCPNCGAVVYPGEKVCWKCGTKLASPAGGSPLPSAPKG